ncbi:glycosyltransferase family 4 protein [Paeniglutamicibacter antarcticus]|uniref:D-inositol 3-phosphate glycosyltransferase n=2 Tax=Paeniglutamicibacter antarcticus TaxID=494023 RepID=A0ABP9TRJ7_9MICC
MRIAVLAHLHHPISQPFAGGMESHTGHLVAGLSSRGHDVTLFAKEGSNPSCAFEPVLAQEFSVAGYPESHGRHRQHAALDGAMDLAIKSVRAGRFDAVLNNSLSPLPHLQLTSVPTLHVLHTPVLPRLAEIFGSAGWESEPAHRHITVSHANAIHWRSWLPEISVIHNGIALNSWMSDVAVEPGTAAWTGRITPEKGTHLAIAAARATSMKLRIAGPVQDHEYFRSLIEPELDADITYLGHLDQPCLRQVIAAAQVFISSPLWEEPFGLTTLEAIACGTPVAALPAGAMSEIISRRSGVVATHRNAHALANAIVLAREMDRQEVRDSAQAFGLDSMITAYERQLRSVLRVPQDAQGRLR